MTNDIFVKYLNDFLNTIHLLFRDFFLDWFIQKKRVNCLCNDQYN